MNEDAQSGPGEWDERFADIAVIRADGSVISFYNGQESFAIGYFGAGVTNQVFGIEHAADTNPVTTAHYYLDDHLGTTQLELASGGWPVWQGQFTPFGLEIINGTIQNAIRAAPYDGTNMRYKFTGKERDTESGLDYFGARYYSSVIGRFSSPDWAAKAEPVPYAKLDNPQTLNLYAYVGNNPLSRIDKDGHYECSGSKEQCGAIRNALTAVKTADANLKAGTTGKAMLDKVLSFYGDEGKKNGVQINFNATDPGALGNTSTKNGITTISFGKDAFSNMQQAGKGETVAHEGTHGVDQKTHPMPQTFWQFYDTEYHAYQAESAVDRGLNTPNETDKYPAWAPGMSPQQRTTNITRDAYSNACYDVGGCQ